MSSGSTFVNTFGASSVVSDSISTSICSNLILLLEPDVSEIALFVTFIKIFLTDYSLNFFCSKIFDFIIVQACTKILSHFFIQQKIPGEAFVDCIVVQKPYDCFFPACDWRRAFPFQFKHKQQAVE
uniref:Uncharacterized protein n=1 Tax=Candida albicans TaxID=5476 RepID=G1UA31_CANAX|nr:unknown [Candida albicans]